MMRRLLFVLSALLPLVAGAREKIFQYDSATGSAATAMIQGIFNEGEAIGVVFTPDAADYPVVITSFRVEAVPADGSSSGQPSAFLVNVWKDDGTGATTPSTTAGDHLVTGLSVGVTPTLEGISEVSLGSPLTITSGSFRVGLTFQQDAFDESFLPYATVATDTAAIANDRYTLCVIATPGTPCSWVKAESAGVTHNYIIRAVTTVAGSVTPDAGPIDTDAGHTDTDAGHTDADAGNDTDAGHTETPDAGTPTGDAPIVTGITPSDNTVGESTPVVIQGFHFVAGTTFALNDTPLSRVVVTPPNLANAEVPSSLGVGEYDVIATNPDGQKGILPHAFQVASKAAKQGCGPGPADLLALLGLAGVVARRRRRS
jgi:MYXO-CTERM domain-containing protein